jgi:small subunit ribosomal protein S18
MNLSKRRRAPLHLTDTIDYKNTDLLRRFVSQSGKILHRRRTNLTAKQQRAVSRAIKQARMMGLLHFTHKDQ